nr:hypothetical protein [Tanacetum cinerariifolium]
MPVLDTGKFKQWQFRIQQYLQHEHYSLWKVIEFGDSYKVPTNTDPDDTTTRRDDEKFRRTVTFTTEDMQKKKNDVKARTTLLLSLPDEHQLRFSKYKTAKELWAAILKIFGGNEATKKRKKNLLKQQYGNFKAEGSKTLEQTFNRLQVISNGSQIKFKDINQIDEDDMEEMDIKWNMALLSIRADKFWKRTRKKISIQGSDVVELEEVKLEKDGLDGKLAGLLKASKNLDHLIESQRSDQVKERVGYNAIPPPAADLYLSLKKDLSWTGLPEFVDDTVTD